MSNCLIKEVFQNVGWGIDISVSSTTESSTETLALCILPFIQT